MRIVSAELLALRIPLHGPIDTAIGVSRVLERGLLRVVAEGRDGLVGHGEVVGPAPAGATDGMTRVCVGLDATDTRAVAALLEQLDATPWGGRAVRSGLSSALSDLVARARGRSVAADLGSTQPSESVALNGLIGRSAPSLAAARAAALAGEGFGCLKVKGGAEPATATVERMAAVRAAVGHGVGLRLDLNGSLETAEAEALLPLLERFDLEYVEQPLADTASAVDLARLRRHTAVPIAADESVDSLSAARSLLDADAVDALVVKPARVGGLAEAVAIVELATRAGVGVTISTLLETGVGLAGALQVASLVPGHGAHGLATASLLPTDLLAIPLAVSDGRMAVPAGPGLGVELDMAAVERWSVA